MTHIVIAIPSTGTHETNMSMSFGNMLASINGSTNGIANISLMSIEHASPAIARNVLAGWGIECGADYVFWIDSDIGVPRDSLPRLLAQAEARGLDILGCTYAQRLPPFAVHGLPMDRTQPLKEALRIGGIKEFEWLPGGCMLVSTKVYERLPKPWYWESYGYEGSAEIQLVHALRDALKAEFPDDLLYRAARILEPCAKLAEPLTVDHSEDTNFCRKARRYKFTVWADMTLSQELVHMGKNPVCIGQTRAVAAAQPHAAVPENQAPKQLPNGAQEDAGQARRSLGDMLQGLDSDRSALG